MLRGGEGAHQGIKPANMPEEVFAACWDGRRFDRGVFRDLHCFWDLGGLYDILEGEAVGASWRAAAAMNAGGGT